MAMHSPIHRADVHSPGRNTTTKITMITTMNCRIKSGVIFEAADSMVGSAFGMYANFRESLFYEALADAMNKIGVRRSQSREAHVRRNLSPMICRVRDHMHQDVIFAAAPLFALAIFIADRRRQLCLTACRQVGLPQP